MAAPPSAPPRTSAAPARAFAPVWAWLRLDLRRRARSLAVLALLIAIAAGTVMAVTAGARRGGSAGQRLEARTLPATVGAVPNQPGFDWAPIRRLPEVAAMTEFLLTGTYAIEGIPEANGGFPQMDAELGRTLERPVVLSGRLPDQSRVDEAAISAKFASEFRRSVGDTVIARLNTPSEADAALSLDTSAPNPTGPRQPLKIVGIVRSPLFIDNPTDPGGIATTAAFTARYRENLTGTTDQYIVNAFVRLKRGAADIPAFEHDFARVTGRQDVDFIDFAALARSGKKETSFERGALLAFALSAFAAALVLIGQAIVRYTAAAAAEVGGLRAFGLTTSQATAAAIAGPVLACAVGLAVAIGAAVAASPIFPIGSAHYVEPNPGVSVDALVLGALGGLVLAMVIVSTTVTAWLGLRPGGSRARSRRSAIARGAYRSGLPVPTVVGTRFALEPGGAAGAATRPALVGAVAGVLGVLAAFTFQSGVLDAVHSPARFGQTFQIAGWIGFNGEDPAPSRPALASVAADPDVAAVNDTRVGAATVAGASTTLFSYDPVDTRPLAIPMVSGRMPAAADEIALSPAKAQAVHARLGELVTVDARAKTRMRLTGTAFVPEDPHSSYNEGAWVTGAGFKGLFPDGFFKYHETRIELKPGADPTAVTRRLAANVKTVEFGPPMTPQALSQLRFVRSLPAVLGVFLGLLAVGAVGHALFVAVRRRRHEVAVLRALGLTGWQSRGIVATQAAALVAIGLALGVPLGLAIGRIVWRSVATSTPALYVAPTAVLTTALIAPVVITIAAALATAPARHAARMRVPDVLRAE